MNDSSKQLKIGIILNYINLLAGNLVPVFYTPVMLRLLGQSEYGLYRLSSSVTSYLGLISMGIGSAVNRYLIKAREEEGKQAEEEMLGLFMIIFQIIGIIALAAGFILSKNLDLWYGDSLSPDELFRMRVIVLLMTVNTAIGFQLSPYLSIITAHEKFIFLQATNIVYTCGLPVLNLIVLYLGYASVGMAVTSLGFCIVTRIISLVYVIRYIRVRARYNGNYSKDLISEILQFSFWVFVANIVGQLYNSTDTVMIGTIPSLGTKAVAVYNVGAVFNHIVFNLSVGLSTMLTPKTNKMVFAGATNDELTNLAIKVGRIQCYIVTLIVTGFIAFGRPFISIYAGNGYEAAYWVAVLMMIPSAIPLVQSVCLSVIVAQNKHRFRSIVYLGIAILNVIGTWYLMRTRLGIVGAALMTGAATVLGQGFVMNWYYWKRTGLEIIRFWKNLSRLYFIPVIMCIITLLAGRFVDFYKFSNMVSGIAIYTVVFMILNWKYMMNGFEKDLFIAPVNGIKAKLRAGK